MERILTLILFAVCLTTYAQETKEQTMEKRAREMHRVLGLDSKDEWREFIKKNYSQALIDKPMRMVVEESKGSESSTSSSKPTSTDNLEAKVGMFERLHEDFGSSKIVSIKPAADKAEMVLQTADGLNGKFVLKFTAAAPYLIDGLGIEAGD